MGRHLLLPHLPRLLLPLLLREEVLGGRRAEGSRNEGELLRAPVSGERGARARALVCCGLRGADRVFYEPRKTHRATGPAHTAGRECVNVEARSSVHGTIK